MKSQPATRLGALFLLPIATLLSSSAFGQRPFTAKDDVGLALFEYAGRGAPGGVIKYSPDGRYFVVVTGRGRLDLNVPEDTIWVFRIEDVQRFVQHPEQGNLELPYTWQWNIALEQSLGSNQTVSASYVAAACSNSKLQDPRRIRTSESCLRSTLCSTIQLRKPQRDAGAYPGSVYRQ